MADLTPTHTRGRLPAALVRRAYAAPGRTAALWLLGILALTPGLLWLEVDTSTDSVLDRADPQWTLYQESQGWFGGDEILVVALTGATPYDPQVLAAVRRLSQQFAGLPGVRRVDSVSTVPVVHVDAEGEIELDPALLAGDIDGERVRARLAVDRIAPRSLVSEDGRVFAVNLVLEQGAGEGHEALVGAVRDAVADLDAAVSGVPVFRVETNGRTRTEVVLFAPFTALALIVLLAVVFRSAAVVALCLSPGILGAWVLLAAMGLRGSPLTITTMILPSVILALGCAYAMHMVAAARSVRDASELEPALVAVALPVALSGLTTGVGFAAIGLVRIEAVRFVGGFGAIGVLAVTAAALTLLPAGLRLLAPPTRDPAGFRWMQGPLAAWLTALARLRRRPLLLLWAAALLVFSLGVSRVQVETDATQWLPVGNPVRDAYESIRARLSGISPVNVVLEATGDRPVTHPEVLAQIDALARHLEARPDVGKAISLADPLRQIHGGFIEDPSQPLPDNLPLIEQYLLLLESVEHIADLVTDDRRQANLLLRADHNGSSHLRRIAAEAERWWAEEGPLDVAGRPTGIMYEYARAEDEIAWGQLRGLSFALVVIMGILLVIFRWVRLALVSLLPNVVPLILVFGAMGFLGVPLDAGTVLVGSLALGIAVDDTVHLVSGFVEAHERGLGARQAIERAFARALPAIVYTTAIVAIAFAILGFSEFTFTKHFGLLTGSIMLLCLVSDATLLPALLIRLPRSRRPAGAG